MTAAQWATKAGFIDDVKSGALVVTSFKLHDVHVRVLGNVAFVQGFDDEESSYKGKQTVGLITGWMSGRTAADAGSLSQLN